MLGVRHSSERIGAFFIATIVVSCGGICIRNVLLARLAVHGSVDNCFDRVFRLIVVVLRTPAWSSTYRDHVDHWYSQ